jgi:hypothetical protein
MVDYAPIAAQVQGVIADLGRTITLRHITDASLFDDQKPWEQNQGQVESDVLVTAVILSTVQDRSSLEVFGVTRNATVIQANKQLGLIAAADLAFIPSTRDFILDGSDTWKVNAVDVTKPGDTALLYILELEK